MANDIKRYPVPLIFKKVLKDKMSGELIVSNDSIKRKLFFTKGDLVFASSTVIQERLGEILLATGRITGSEFTKLTKIKQNTTRKVGEILVEITNLTMQDVYYALLYQVKTIALATFSFKQGEWKFINTNPKIPGNQRFKIKLPEIIIEGVKKIDKISYYRNRFCYRCPVTTTIPGSIGRFLSSDEIKFYINLTNFTNIPVKDIISKLKMPENFFWRNIALFYLLNIMDFVEFTVDKELNKNIEEINDLYEKMKSNKLDYYELFGVKNTSPTSEIKESYFRFSKKYHPDRLQVAPDSTVKKKANEVFAEINKVFEVLSNENKKREYDFKGYKEKQKGKGDVLPGNLVQKARTLYLKANALYKHKKYWEAASMLEDAVKMDASKPSYFLLLGLCQAKSPETVKMAEKNLKKASEMEPWNADPVFALGELYRSENFVKKAKVHFKKALELNMDHTLAGKAIKDLELLYSKKKPILSVFGKKK
jgi:curved DNA-binding protein CbpA